MSLSPYSPLQYHDVDRRNASCYTTRGGGNGSICVADSYRNRPCRLRSLAVNFFLFVTSYLAGDKTNKIFVILKYLIYLDIRKFADKNCHRQNKSEQLEQNYQRKRIIQISTLAKKLCMSTFPLRCLLKIKSKEESLSDADWNSLLLANFFSI